MPFNPDSASAAGKKGGKHRKPSESVRNKQMHLAVTESEFQMIDTKATKHNLSRVELVVRAVGEYGEKGE